MAVLALVQGLYYLVTGASSGRLVEAGLIGAWGALLAG